MATTTKRSDHKAELIKADTALRSFRDGGYTLGDAVGETVDNSIQAGATAVRLDWHIEEVQVGKAKKKERQVVWFAVADDGSGIPEDVLADVLTVGFSMRYGSRDGIGRFGVGFKLASISQARRLEVYNRPAFLHAVPQKQDDGSTVWAYKDKNKEGKVFMTYLDLDEIDAGTQTHYGVDEVEDFPEECTHLMEENATGTLIVWRKTDRLNHEQSYAERVDEKLGTLWDFLRRAYRYYIDGGLKIYLKGSEEPLVPYDPLFELDNPEATKLGNGESMRGEPVEQGEFPIDGHLVKWRVQLSPKVTRMYSGGGGDKGPAGPKQFQLLKIEENQGKISFLRHNREISYTIVPKLLPKGIDKVDRYVGIELAFPPALDEYFQVKHIKRGAEPVDKLRERLREILEKPVTTARDRIRKYWGDVRRAEPKPPDGLSGDRSFPESIAQDAEPGMPTGQGGISVTLDEEENRLREIAESSGITEPEKQDEFIRHARQKPVVPVEDEWRGKGLLDIDHLHSTVVVAINRKHPLIQDVYLPLKEAIAKNLTDLDTEATVDLLQRARDAFDLLLFAYAKAENMSKSPEEDYGQLREYWGTFAAAYLKARDKAVSS